MHNASTNGTPKPSKTQVNIQKIGLLQQWWIA